MSKRVYSQTESMNILISDVWPLVTSFIEPLDILTLSRFIRVNRDAIRLIEPQCKALFLRISNHCHRKGFLGEYRTWNLYDILGGITSGTILFNMTTTLFIFDIVGSSITCPQHNELPTIPRPAKLSDALRHLFYFNIETLGIRSIVECLSVDGRLINGSDSLQTIMKKPFKSYIIT